MGISLPLDSTASGQADDVLYCANQHEPALFDGRGGRMPLSVTDPGQQHLRDLWCELYEDIIAHHRDGSRPFPDCGSSHAHHAANCSHCLGTASPKGGGPPASPNKEASSDPVCTVEGCPEHDEDSVDRLRIRITILFDGTNNNKTNVKSGTEKNSDESYSNYYSNIALIEMAGLGEKNADFHHHKMFYIEGAGTTDNKGDEFAGYSLGLGETGVISKVLKGAETVYQFIYKIAKDYEKDIEYVHIDAMGFSRGAASARNFIHQVVNNEPTSLETWLKKNDCKIGEVAAKFIGLFDTVASFDAIHSNDTKDLHLNSLGKAEKVVQLAAAEEHREKFRLTDIRSAGINGTEIFLPGVHSDVGGGYPDNVEEDNVQLFDIDSFFWNSKAQNSAIERERAWLVNSGWYMGKGELLKTNLANEVRGSREKIRNTYQRIPLHIMAEYARSGGVPISDKIEFNYSIANSTLLSESERELLKKANSAIRIAIEKSKCGSPEYWFGGESPKNDVWHKPLRNKFLHTSAVYGKNFGAMQPQFSNNDLVKGRRKRIIQDG